jgi:DNA-binding PadR family transcriptional regulator
MIPLDTADWMELWRFALTFDGYSVWGDETGAIANGILEPHWFQILLALADRDLHGLPIMNEVLERTGGRLRLWPGMLCRALGRLADMNLIVEIEPPDGAAAAGGRPRFFRITTAGRRACAAEAERLAGFVEVARRRKLLKA